LFSLEGLIAGRLNAGDPAVRLSRFHGRVRMQAFPHRYTVEASGPGTGDVELKGRRIADTAVGVADLVRRPQ
jgi:hypothetical protein